jgi:hypothetical protein
MQIINQNKQRVHKAWKSEYPLIVAKQGWSYGHSHFDEMSLAA